MVLLAPQLQPIIDELIAEGVNKIIVQSHLQQIANEQLLATLLQRRRHHPGGRLEHPACRCRRRAGGVPGPEADRRGHLSDRDPGRRRQDHADRQHRRRVHLSRPPGRRFRRQRRHRPRQPRGEPVDQRRLCLDGRERRGSLGHHGRQPRQHGLRRRHQGRQGSRRSPTPSRPSSTSRTATSSASPTSIWRASAPSSATRKPISAT